MEPHIQIGFCLIASSQNYTNLPDSWICGRFADFCGRFAGHFGQKYALVLGMRMAWYVPGMQPGCSQ